MTTSNYYAPVLAGVNRQRRLMGGESPETFAKVYLTHHFPLAPSRVHKELFGMLADATKSRPKRLAIAAPRGHAKTTVVSLAYVLWSILYQREMFILIVSATREQAVQLLKTIKDELQCNTLLIQDFPNECYPPGAKPAPKPWRDNQIVLRNGVSIRALGANQGIRGTKHQQHRPSLIIVDDVEEQEQAQSAEQREKLRGWFEKTLLKAGNQQTNVIVVGTIIHYDSLLANLTDPRRARGKGGGWDNRKYQAVESFSERLDLWDKWEAIYVGEDSFEGLEGSKAADAFFDTNREEMLKGTKVLWPELENYQQLMVTRIVEGRFSFQSEKQNDPLDPSECIFSEASIRYWDKEFADVAELLTELGSRAQFYGACDPSLGRRAGRGDYTAIITLVRDSRTKVMYVVGADIARLKPDQIIENIIQLARMHRFHEFTVESNQFQELLADQLSNRATQAGVSLRVKKVISTANKQARIQSLEPLIAQGLLRFSRRHQLLLEQLRQFPLGGHDDGPDALEIAVGAAHRRRHITIVEQL